MIILNVMRSKLVNLTTKCEIILGLRTERVLYQLLCSGEIFLKEKTWKNWFNDSIICHISKKSENTPD